MLHPKAEPAEKPEKAISRPPSSRFVGLAPPEVGRILGKPDQIREEAMMIRWTYAAENCALDIFFYPDITTGSFRALKCNVANIKGRPGRGRECIN